MISNEILNKQIFMMTGREFLELFNIIKEEKTTEYFTDEDLVYGMDGLANLLNCGKTKAQQIKNSGVINEAIIQHGRKPIFSKRKVLELLKEA